MTTSDVSREHSKQLFHKLLMTLATIGQEEKAVDDTQDRAVSVPLVCDPLLKGGNGDSSADTYDTDLSLIHLANAISKNVLANNLNNRAKNQHIEETNLNRFKLLMSDNHKDFMKTIDDVYKELDPFTLKYLNKLMATAIPFISQLKLYHMFLFTLMPKVGTAYKQFHRTVIAEEDGDFQKYDDSISSDLRQLLVKYENSAYYIASKDKAQARKQNRYEKKQIMSRVLKDTIAGKDQQIKAKEESVGKRARKEEEAQKFVGHRKKFKEDEQKEQELYKQSEQNVIIAQKSALAAETAARAAMDAKDKVLCAEKAMTDAGIPTPTAEEEGEEAAAAEEEGEREEQHDQKTMENRIVGIPMVGHKLENIIWHLDFSKKQ